MIALLAACADDASPERVAWDDVVPVLDRRCVGCHAEGAVGPFSVEESDEAAAWAEPIASAAADRTMPPFLVDNSGACRSFETDAWLPDDEIALLRAWADGGAPGEGPGPVHRPPEAIDAPDRVLDIGVDYTPLLGPDDYRCFVVDPGLDADAFLTSYQVLPGDPAIVHHVILYTLDSDAAEDAADALDALDEAAGYTCFGSAIVPESRPIAAWAPGTPLTAFPDDVGIRLASGRRLVLQVHYNTAVRSGTDRTSVQLALEDGVAREGLVVLLTDLQMVLPPGEASAVHTWELPLGQLGLPLGAYVRGVFPHMHLRGRTLRLEVLRASDGTSECAVDVPRWDFDWQQVYFYEDALYVDPDDTLRLTCSYDTSGDAAEVRWGEGTEDEMCLVGLIATFG